LILARSSSWSRAAVVNATDEFEAIVNAIDDRREIVRRIDDCSGRLRACSHPVDGT